MLGISDWAKDLLVSRGALVEEEKGESFRALLPDEVAKAVGASEWLTLQFGAGAGADDAGDWLERLGALLPSEPRIVGAHLRHFPTAPRIDAAAVLDREFAVQNGSTGLSMIIRAARITVCSRSTTSWIQTSIGDIIRAEGARWGGDFVRWLGAASIVQNCHVGVCCGGAESIHGQPAVAVLLRSLDDCRVLSGYKKGPVRQIQLGARLSEQPEHKPSRKCHDHYTCSECVNTALLEFIDWYKGSLLSDVALQEAFVRKIDSLCE